jgi:DNA-directed RNA polymerase specialized sigma24 family protein
MTRPATWVYVVAVRELRRRERGRGRRTSAGEESGQRKGEPDHAELVVSTTVREVGRSMRCSGTVKSTLRAALQRLRVDLADESLEGVRDGRGRTPRRIGSSGYVG